MFKNQVRAAKEGQKHSRNMRKYYAARVHFVEPESINDYTKGILYWGNREECYREVLSILEGLQAEYRKRFYLFGLIPWPCRNGHDVKLGLRLKANARLRPLEERAGVVEPDDQIRFGG